MTELQRQAIRTDEPIVRTFLTVGIDRDGVYVTVQVWGGKVIYGDLWEMIV